MGIGEVIRGSLSAEVGSLLIGVVSHAGSPRPESPQRLGSIAHVGHMEEDPMREPFAGEVSLYSRRPLSPNQRLTQPTQQGNCPSTLDTIPPASRVQHAQCAHGCRVLTSCAKS